ncbi:unnamed protein product [Pedinophyceae sp. YPF-701]|nr:unnamed protein product [Pedinophyceae sp. YPF-701]
MTPDVESERVLYQRQAGADIGDDGIAASFGNDASALEALDNGVVLLDLSHWGRLRLSGGGRKAFLHGQTTNDINSLQKGQSRETVVTDPQARTVDLMTVIATDNALLCVTSPGMAAPLAQRFEKYIFPADDVAVQDVSERTAMLALAGPESDAVLGEIGLTGLAGQPVGSSAMVAFKGSPVVATIRSVFGGGDAEARGCVIVADESVAGDLWRVLALRGAVPMGSVVAERARVMKGRPMAGAELTKEFTALEAGLYFAIAEDKGCYVGQEAISKVVKHDAVRRQLWGFRMPPGSSCAVGATMYDGNGEELGPVTSVVEGEKDGEVAGLAYVRCRYKGKQANVEAMLVRVGECEGITKRIPFAKRSF